MATSVHQPRRRISRALLSSAVDLIFPPRCLACRAAPPVERAGERRFCEQCAKAIEADRGQESCPTCAATVAQYEVSGEQCTECRGTRPKVKAQARVGPYQGLLGQMLRQFKYGNREELLPVLGGWLAERVRGAPWLDRVEAVTCVPTHWRRQLRTRAYPAGDLARHVARRLNLPFVSILSRIRAGRHQVGLSHNDRLKNVIDAFAMRRGVQLDEARLLIIDDVRTTGATLNECAKVLHRAGVAETYGAVIVRARAAHGQSTVAAPF